MREQEQMEIFTLQEDIIEIWETNKVLAEKIISMIMNDDEKKVKKMNSEMQHFFDPIPFSNLTATNGTQTDAFDTNNNEKVCVKGKDLKIRQTGAELCQVQFKVGLAKQAFSS